MIKFLLSELEKTPNPTFSKNELLSVSPEAFKQLSNKKILSYSRPKETDLEQVLYLHCQHGCPLSVTEVDGELEGICLEHSEESPVPITKDDLSRYAFSIDALLDQVRTANRIEGSLQNLHKGIIYVGHKTFDDSRIGFVFAQALSGNTRLTLSGLGLLSKEDDYLLVFTPASIVEDIVLKADLNNDKMIYLPLATNLDPVTFELPMERLISELLGRDGATEITETQHGDYDRFEYKCRDKIHIPGTIPLTNSNHLKVNENELKIGDVLFLLFLRLVEELKKEAGGWVSLGDLEPLGIITDPGNYQVYSRLRTELKGSLIDEEKDARKFIENNGQRQYRISTHPDFITYNRDKLINHNDNRVKNIARNLPAS